MTMPIGLQPGMFPGNQRQSTYFSSRTRMRGVCVAVIILVAAMLILANYQPAHARNDCPQLTGAWDGNNLDAPFALLQVLECSGGAGANMAWVALGLDERAPWSPQDELEITSLFVEVADATVSDPPLITLYTDAEFAKTAMNLADCASMICVHSSVQGNSQYAVLTVSKQQSDEGASRTWEHLVFQHDLGGWQFLGRISNFNQFGGPPGLRIITGGDTVWLALNGVSSAAGATWSFDRWFDLSLDAIEKEQIWFYHWTTASFRLGASLMNVSAVARPRFSQSTTGALQFTLIYEIYYGVAQGEEIMEIARLKRQAVYAWDDATEKFIFEPTASTVTADLLTGKFASFADGAAFLRFAGDELRTPYLDGSPEQQAARRAVVEGMEDSPEKQALLPEMAPGVSEPEKSDSAPTTTCADGLPTRLAIEVQASVTPGDPNALWSDWEGADRKKVDTMLAGTTMLVLAGPKCRNGYTWWQVRSLETNLTGWTAESRGGEGYFLEPQ